MARLLKPEELEAALGRGSPAPIHVLTGPAEYLIERFVRRLAEVAGATRVVVEADAVSPEEVEVEHLAPDLFATPRLVQVQGTGWKPKVRRSFLEKLSDAGLAPGRWLVLSHSATRPPKDAGPGKVVGAFFWNPFPSVLPRLAAGWLRDHGGRPGRGVGERLVEFYGDDLRRLDQEARKLAVSIEGPVGPEDVDRLCPRPTETRSFRVAEAITSGDRAGALESLEELLEVEAAHGLLAMLANRFRRMLALDELAKAHPRVGRQALRAARELEEARGRPLARSRRTQLEGAIQELLGLVEPDASPDLAELKVWQARGLLDHLRRFERSGLEAGIRDCARADRHLKGEGGAGEWALEELVVRLATCSEGGRRAPSRP